MEKSTKSSGSTTYTVIPELYQITAERLLEQIGDREFYAGTLAFDYGTQECRLSTTLIIYRCAERMPEGERSRIVRIVPVWWEFHTTDAVGEERYNDFCMDELIEYML